MSGGTPANPSSIRRWAAVLLVLAIVGSATAHRLIGIRQLERVAPGDVEPVEEAIANEVEICGHRSTGVTVEGAQRLEHLVWLAVRLEELPSIGILRDLCNQPLELGDADEREWIARLVVRNHRARLDQLIDTCGCLDARGQDYLLGGQART